MKPLEKEIALAEASKQSSDDGRRHREQRTKDTKERKNSKRAQRRRVFLDEEREYHIILWGATGFAGRFAAEHLAHYYMKHEDPSLYPFKSSAFPPVCPVAEEPADGTAITKTEIQDATALGFLPSGLTPGEHKPGITPPFQGISAHGKKKSLFNNMLAEPYDSHGRNRALGAEEATSPPPEYIPPTELSFVSAVSALEDGQASAHEEGLPSETSAVDDVIEQIKCRPRAARPTNYTEQTSSDSFTNSQQQCRSRGNSGSPVRDEKEQENLPGRAGTACESRLKNKNAVGCQVCSRTSLEIADDSQAWHTPRVRERRGQAENGRGDDSEGKDPVRQSRETRDLLHSTSPVQRKHRPVRAVRQASAGRGHEEGKAEEDEKESEFEDAVSNVSSRGEAREGKAEEGTEAIRKKAEPQVKGKNAGSKQRGGFTEDYHLGRVAKSQHEGAAVGGGGENKDKEDGKYNSSTRQKGSNAVRTQRKQDEPPAPQEEGALKSDGKTPPSQHLEACSGRSCDVEFTYSSSLSPSGSCLDSTPEGNRASEREKIRFALAGRSMAKLRQLRYQLAERLGKHCMHIDLFAVNPVDDEDLRKLCSRGRVVLSTCSPYRLCGESIVKACVSASTHYCDITAEVSYVADMAAKYGAAAAEKKLKLLFFCGAASLPSDLAVLLTQREALRRRGTPCHEIRTAVTDCFGGFSGGSVMGLGHIFEEGAVFDPFFLVKYASPSPPSEQEILPYIRPQIYLARHEENFGYCAYNFLAPLNENVVRLSTVLLGLYAREDSQRDTAFSRNASEAAEEADAAKAFDADEGRKKENRTYVSFFPWGATSASSPLSAASSTVSRLLRGGSCLKPSGASGFSSSNCTPCRSCKCSSASSSPCFSSSHSPTASPTSSPRRRNCSLPSYAASPFSEASPTPSAVMPPTPLFGSSASSLQHGSTRRMSADTPAAKTGAAMPVAALVSPPSASPAATAAHAVQQAVLSPAEPDLDIFPPLRPSSTFFHYSECVALGYDMLTASIVSLVTFVLMFLVTSSFCRAALTALHIFPLPGEGPPRQFLNKGHFQIKTIGRVYPSSRLPDDITIDCCSPVDDDEEEAENEQERRFYKPPHCHDRETVITVTLGSASGDPGYKETGKMLVETGLAVALHIEDCFELCGVCTPASGVGFVLVDRLRKAGMKFEVKVKQF